MFAYDICLNSFCFFLIKMALLFCSITSKFYIVIGSYSGGCAST